MIEVKELIKRVENTRNDIIDWLSTHPVNFEQDCSILMSNDIIPTIVINIEHDILHTNIGEYSLYDLSTDELYQLLNLIVYPKILIKQ